MTYTSNDCWFKATLIEGTAETTVEDGEAFKFTGDETDAEGLGGGVLARRSLLIVLVEPTFARVGGIPRVALGFGVEVLVRFCTVFLAIFWIISQIM